MVRTGALDSDQAVQGQVDSPVPAQADPALESQAGLIFLLVWPIVHSPLAWAGEPGPVAS